MIDRFFETLRQAGSVARPELLRVLWDAGLLRPDSPQGIARALPHLAARGPHLGLAFMIHARGQGSRPAVTDASGTLTWRQLNDRTIRIGRGFRRRGVQPGERVAFLLPSGREFVECLGAAQKAAAWAVAVPHTWDARRVAAALTEQRPRVLVYGSERTAVVAAALDGLDVRPSLVAVGAGEHVPGSSAYEEVLAGADRQEFRPRPVPQPGIVLYDVHDPDVRGIERDTAPAFAAAVGFLRVVPLRRRDRVLIDGPLWDGLGFGILAVSLVLGADIHLPGPLGDEDLLHLLEDERVSTAVLSPERITSLVDVRPEVARSFDRSRMQIVLTAGIEADVRRRASNLLGPVIYDVFGTTRAGWVSVSRPEDYERKPASAGRPVPGVTVVVRGPDGTALPAGVEGELEVRSDLAFGGWSDPEPGEDAPPARRAMTAGRAWIDDEGYVFRADAG